MFPPLVPSLSLFPLLISFISCPRFFHSPLSSPCFSLLLLSFAEFSPVLNLFFSPHFPALLSLFPLVLSLFPLLQFNLLVSSPLLVSPPHRSYSLIVSSPHLLYSPRFPLRVSTPLLLFPAVFIHLKYKSEVQSRQDDAGGQPAGGCHRNNRVVSSGPFCLLVYQL